MNIFGLYITRVSKLKKERKIEFDAMCGAAEDLVSFESSRLGKIIDKDRAKYTKQNTLWNRVISKLLFENHQLRLAK